MFDANNAEIENMEVATTFAVGHDVACEHVLLSIPRENGRETLFLFTEWETEEAISRMKAHLEIIRQAREDAGVHKVEVVLPPEAPQPLMIDFTDELQMVMQQGDGRPLSTDLGERGMTILLLKATAAIDAWKAKQAAEKQRRPS